MTGDPALYFARDVVVPKRNAKRIGVNITNWCDSWGNGQEQTVRILSELALWLIREGWTVTLFPAMPVDHDLATDILKNLDSNRARIYGSYTDCKGFLDELEAQDLFVGVRLHTVIGACCVYTPAIMIGYQPKCLDFMRTMDLEEYHVRTDRLDLDQLIAMIRTMSGQLESIQRKQFERPSCSGAAFSISAIKSSDLSSRFQRRHRRRCRSVLQAPPGKHKPFDERRFERGAPADPSRCLVLRSSGAAPKQPLSLENHPSPQVCEPCRNRPTGYPKRCRRPR